MSNEPRPQHPAWGAVARREPRWPASLAALTALALYAALPESLTEGPTWIVPVFEGLLLVPLTIAAPHRQRDESRPLRALALALIGLTSAANVGSLVLLVQLLLTGHSSHAGAPILLAAVQIWLTNVLVFALWYWELDRGGPGARLRADHCHPDFLFPQMITPACAVAAWSPGFVDYLYVSFTNATAFSPTDTMPLTAWAKILMVAQSLASLLTVVLVAARAVNILP